MTPVRLTEYSHGAGCGCKISPAVLDVILDSPLAPEVYSALLVGNSSRDDAAVYDLGNGTAVISTTDFFMPIVDDPFTFGRIAATNAISDIYAMGGKPLMAIAIFGWPLDKLAPEIGRQVIEGGRQACQDAGIPLAGGHSIDAPEPIFGLAVTGLVQVKHLKQNSTAQAGDQLYLTKPLGIGILSTAQKRKILLPEHSELAIATMCQLNDLGAVLGTLPSVHALTDVTGFGLGGHLREMCEASGLQAVLAFEQIPLLAGLDTYLAQDCTPGGTQRNFASYGSIFGGELSLRQQQLLCDPQTSGGLLIALAPEQEAEFLAITQQAGFNLESIGYLRAPVQGQPLIKVG
ncbi:selenide, water dikinase SelD [Thiothrix eikelboomii]|uniref:selenide, water dikinase SelD n=1 Tax=Thiothrix eikelboomii TaxID=92487 RepID=UPI003BB0A894